MSSDDLAIRTGGCLCGAVRFEVRGEPDKTGLCHCADCRKVTGSAFLAFADWHPDRFRFTGTVETFNGRSFCPRCGGRLFNLSRDQAEIYLGALDEAPSGLVPKLELWVKRREPWVHPLDVPQHREDPPPSGEAPGTT
jgi:hypothetical protein